MFIVNLFPSASSFTFSTSFSAYFGSIDKFINMPMLLTVISVFVVYEVAIIGVRTVIWLKKTIFF
jgi:hypothetical protein